MALTDNCALAEVASNQEDRIEALRKRILDLEIENQELENQLRQRYLPKKAEEKK